jgi:hypothetical protein
MNANAVTVTNVNASATSVSLLTANQYRTGATIYNNADRTLRLAFTAPATADNSVVALTAQDSGAPGGYYEVPYGYTGTIYGIWDSVPSAPTGKANICELR